VVVQVFDVDIGRGFGKTVLCSLLSECSRTFPLHLVLVFLLYDVVVRLIIERFCSNQYTTSKSEGRYCTVQYSVPNPTTPILCRYIGNYRHSSRRLNGSSSLGISNGIYNKIMTAFSTHNPFAELTEYRHSQSKSFTSR